MGGAHEVLAFFFLLQVEQLLRGVLFFSKLVVLLLVFR